MWSENQQPNEQNVWKFEFFRFSENQNVTDTLELVTRFQSVPRNKERIPHAYDNGAFGGPKCFIVNVINL
jgi:hypothetical protein